MAAQVEKIVEGAVGGEKALSLAGRFKPPHLAVHSLSNLDIRASKFNFESDQWRYFPKRTGFHQVSQEQVNEVVARLSNTPRKILNYQTPLEVFTSYMMATGRIDS
jgi:hypothetical protein